MTPRHGITDLESRIPGSPSSSSRRLDPFYDGVWARGQSAQWRSRRRMVARRSAGLGRRVHWFEPSTEDIARAEHDLHRRSREAKLAVLGALDGWRTMTIEQCAALTGIPEILAGRARIIRDLYALDLMDVGHGEGFSDMQVQQRDVAEWLIRPTRSARYEELIEPRLTYSEALQITGAREWITGGQYDRHNVIATELALQLAEHSTAAAVLGERWSGASELMYEGWGRPDPYPQYAGRGDFTIVRRDGLRIVVELTASASGASFEKKVDRWAQRLSADTLTTQGTVVLFIMLEELHPITGRRGDPKGLYAKVRNQITKSIRKYPGTHESRTGERMFFAQWSELFPDRHTRGFEFEFLPAYTPAGVYRVDAENVWDRKLLLSEQEVFYWPAAGDEPTAVVDNARMFWCTPWWMRQEPAPQIALPLTRALWPQKIPGVVAGDQRPKGAAGAVTLPARVVL